MTTAISCHNSISLQDSVSSDSYKNAIVTDCQIVEPCLYDTVDKPELNKSFRIPSKSEKSIFEKMKYEVNRLYSFKSKWPVNEIKPENLSAAGLFYLQHEDRVQCAFCYIIIFNWTSTDKPLREHMKKSPKCPFLMGLNVGNVPITSREKEQVPVKHVLMNKMSPPRTGVDYKPKHPTRADIRRRLLTYSGWQLQSPTPQQLAECGLYYSGVADVTICFFCGGSLGNWEPHDNPWDEHKKYFPDCAYLSLPRSRSLWSSSMKPNIAESVKSTPISSCQIPSCDVTAEVVEQALNIFPKPVVLDAVKRKGGRLFSLQEICDDILQQNQKQKIEATLSAIPNAALSDTKDTDVTSDALLCKICMDNERGVVFQPCGHLVSCWKCAQMISDCPVCRRPIVNVIRTYFS